MRSGDPFKLLLDMEYRCTSSAAGLPVAEQDDEAWVGVALRLGEDRMIASMNEVQEILELPEFTSVPGVKPWVIGVANVRGNLLPLMDLKSYLIGENIKQRRKGRVVVIDYKGFSTGLLVEEVFGMKHMLLKDQTSELPDVHPNVKPYISKAFRLDDEIWPVLEFKQLTDNDDFANASL